MTRPSLTIFHGQSSQGDHLKSTHPPLSFVWLSCRTRTPLRSDRQSHSTEVCMTKLSHRATTSTTCLQDRPNRMREIEWRMEMREISSSSLVAWQSLR